MNWTTIVVCILLIGSSLAEDIKGYPNDRKEVKDVNQSMLWGVCKTTVSLLSTAFLNSYTVKFLQYKNYWKNKGRLDYEEAWGWGFGDQEILVKGLRNKAFNPNYFCEITFPLCNQEHYKLLTRESYAEKVLSDKPEIIKNNDFIDNLYKEIKNSEDQGEERKTITVHHFSDFHWDLEYVPGESNSCSKLVWCRPNLAPTPEDQEGKAGKWGDYHCDTNPRLTDKLTSALKNLDKPDFTVWTGDNADHGIYNSSQFSTEPTKAITKYLQTNFPDSVIFSIHGNHEMGPTSLQNFTEGSELAMKLLAESWKDWMSPQAYEDYRDRSFYSMLISEHPKASEELKEKLKNVRLIGYNSQNCDFYNRYIIGELGDALNQFEWLENLLKDMEKNNEVGIFFSHISPGMDACFSEVSARIQILMDRYQHILRLNLFGHTHKEEFEVTRSVEDKKPIGVNHLAPSITSSNVQNPSFRTFTLDAETLVPLSVDTYTLDLLKANQDDKYAVFEKNHELTEEYGMKDMSPTSFYELSQKFKDDEDLALKFQVNRHAGSPKYLPEKGCDETCRRRLSCITSNSVYSDVRKCYNWSDITGSFERRSYLFDFLYGYWVEEI